MLGDFLKNCKYVDGGSFVFKHDGVFGFFRAEKSHVKQEDALRLLEEMKPELFSSAPKSLPFTAPGSYCFLVPNDKQSDLPYFWECKNKPKVAWTLKEHGSNFVRCEKAKQKNLRRQVVYLSDAKNQPLSHIFYQYIIIGKAESRIMGANFNLNVQSILSTIVTFEDPTSNMTSSAGNKKTIRNDSPTISEVTSQEPTITSPKAAMTSPEPGMTSPKTVVTSRKAGVTSFSILSLIGEPENVKSENICTKKIGNKREISEINEEFITKRRKFEPLNI